MNFYKSVCWQNACCLLLVENEYLLIQIGFKHSPLLIAGEYKRKQTNHSEKKKKSKRNERKKKNNQVETSSTNRMIEQ